MSRVIALLNSNTACDLPCHNSFWCKLRNTNPDILHFIPVMELVTLKQHPVPDNCEQAGESRDTIGYRCFNFSVTEEGY